MRSEARTNRLWGRLDYVPYAGVSYEEVNGLL